MATLFQQWTDTLENMQDADREQLSEKYYDRETEVYKKVLSQPDTVLKGTFASIAEDFGFEHIYFAGYMDGVNESLKKPYKLEELTPESEIELDIDFEKLYWNMLEANAPWLYGLEEWDGVLSLERRQEITKERNKSKQAVSTKVDRNAPCPCGSGKKYKKCCGAIA